MKTLLLFLLITLTLSLEAQTAHSVTLAWNEDSQYTNFRVYRRPVGRKWWSQLSTGVKLTNYVDKTAQSSQQYDYEVRAVLKNGTEVLVSDPSAVVTVTIPQ